MNRLKPLYRLHGLLGLVAGLPIVLVALSGAALAFAQEIDRALNPGLLAVPPVTGSAFASLDAWRHDLNMAHPDWRLRVVYPPLTEYDPLKLEFADPQERTWEVFVNPDTGRLLGVRDQASGLYRRLYGMHVWLLDGEPGRWLVRASALALLVLALSGLVVLWRRVVPVRSGHARIGLYTAVILVFISTTGLVAALTPVNFRVIEPVFADEERPLQAAVDDAGREPLGQTIEHALTACAARDAQPALIVLPQASKGLIQMICQRRGMPGSLGREYLTLASEAVRQNEPIRYTMHLSDHLLWGLHSGDVLGLPGRIVWMWASLAPLFLGASGLLVWRRRRGRESIPAMSTDH